jgi:hypothetical protein
MQLYKQQRKIVPTSAAASSLTGTATAVFSNTAVIGSHNVGTGFAYVYVVQDGIWTAQQTLTASDGLAGDQFGYAVAISGDTTIVGSNYHDTPSSNCGSAYVSTRSGSVWTEQQKLTASDAAANDRFGFSVAIDGDTCIIGAPYDDHAAADAGSAYVFTRTGGVWTEQQKLTAFDAAWNDQFGYSVAVYGDTCIVGAPQDDDSFSDSGSVYVFTRSGGVWSLQQKLNGSGAGLNYQFGKALALEEDSILSCSSNYSSGRGAIYYFTRSVGVWSEQQLVHMSNLAFSSYLGSSISLSGTTFIAGATGDYHRGVKSGTAYLFTLDSGTWTVDAKLFPLDGAASDLFGGSAALHNGVCVIGSPQDDDNGASTGAAYAFISLPTTDPYYQQRIAPSDLEAGDEFGCAVSVDADTCVIGMRRDDDLGNNAGAAYVYIRNAGVWEFQQKLLASDGAGGMMFGDSFGQSVSVYGDTCVIGADNKNAGEGAAYVFTRSGGVWTEQQKLLASDHAAPFMFGYSVHLNGNDCIVGSIYSDAVTDGGAAYIFTYSGGIWTEQQKLTASDRQSGDEFGTSVAIDSDSCVIGAAYASAPGAGSGASYVFTRSGGIWTEQQKLVSGDLAAGDEFGSFVSILSERCLIGARWNATDGIFSGSAYTFTRSGGVWTEEQKLYPPDKSDGDRFGHSVSLNSDYLLIGSRSDDDIGSSSGSAYLYQLSGSTWLLYRKYRAYDGTASAAFGYSASLNGNDTVVIGAYGDPLFGAQAGAVYFFGVSSLTWDVQQKLTASDGALNDYFGTAVTILDDTCAVGAPFEDDGNPMDDNWGAVYVYTYSTGVWSQQQKITGNGVQVPAHRMDSWFGWAVALLEDVLIIGCPQDNLNSLPSDDGSIYVYTRTAGVWSHGQSIASPGANDFNLFGNSLAVQGTTLIVGSPGEATRTGAVYYYTGSGAAWSQTQILSATVPSPNDLFGWDVSLDSDTCVIGAYGDSTLALSSGAAYVFTRSGGVWTEQQKLTASDGALNDYFGVSVAVAGDICVVGTYNDAAYVFTRSGGVWTETQKLVASDNANWFGTCVAAYAQSPDNVILLVGAGNANIQNALQAGAVYVFNATAGTYYETLKITGFDTAYNDQFGSANTFTRQLYVSADGNLIIGANFNDEVAGDAGAAYAYIGPPPTSAPTYGGYRSGAAGSGATALASRKYRDIRTWRPYKPG